MLSSPRRPPSTILIFSSALYCLRVALRISLTTRSAGALEFARFDFIFVPYSHYDEPKTLSYFMQLICLTNDDGEQDAGLGVVRLCRLVSAKVLARFLIALSQLEHHA